MAKTLGFAMAHYGMPFFSAALESIYDQVDDIVILYTDRPSQGFGTMLSCPDSETDMLDAARPFRDKIIWMSGHWAHEGEHSNAIERFTRGYDWIWRFDCDEISPPGMVDEMIRQAEETKHRAYCVPFVHFWRSFSKCCRDSQMPVRLMRVNGGEGQRYLDSKDGKWFVYHFGYAQPTRYIEYKMEVSGHRPEFRPEWFTERWLPNSQTDVHPVCHTGFWNPMDFDKSQMPLILKRHKYFNAEVIE